MIILRNVENDCSEGKSHGSSQSSGLQSSSIRANSFNRQSLVKCIATAPAMRFRDNAFDRSCSGSVAPVRSVSRTLAMLDTGSVRSCRILLSLASMLFESTPTPNEGITAPAGISSTDRDRGIVRRELIGRTMLALYQ